ncbi:MAG: hypothetical protein IT374_12945 [Polyangiaceae bacterium]|nr:hypothetical protein [Polyangiaceae bacterium]
MRARALLPLACLSLAACVVRGDVDKGTYRVEVSLTMADGSPLPEETSPLCLDLRGASPDPACRAPRAFKMDLVARDAAGQVDTTFNGALRVTVRPGTVIRVTGDAASGRNVRLTNGVATGQLVEVSGTFGPTRIGVEDVGFVPEDATDAEPGCANGRDDDGDGLVDYPADPGCAYANDDTETVGTGVVGVSAPIWFAYPSAPDVQGWGTATPFAGESVVVETRPERGANLIVTRIASGGMFASDLQKDASGAWVPKPYGGLYVFNFSVPPGVRVCDRVTYLSGTMSEFFGYTELSFPSYSVHPWDTSVDGPCQVPEPHVIGNGDVKDALLEPFEAGFVRVSGAHVGGKLGSGMPVETRWQPVDPTDPKEQNPCGRIANTTTDVKYAFSADATNCDFDGSGSIDFTKDVAEATCSCWCYQDPECTQYDTFRARGAFRLVLGPSPADTLQVNAGAVTGFSPLALRGKTLPHVQGTLANFSGGNLNWTIEVRCGDDIVECAAGDDACLSCVPGAACQAAMPKPPDTQTACVKLRTASDDDSDSN